MACGQECADWAIEMLMQGRDSAHLRMLAGMEGPHNHFELAALRDRVLGELGEEAPSRDEAVRLYAKERLRATMDGAADLLVEIEVVAQLYIGNDHQSALQDFCLLHWAYDDLQTSAVQWYWPGADRSNILAIMKRKVEEFVNGKPDNDA